MRVALVRPVRFVAAVSVGVLVVTAAATPSIAATPQVAKAPAALLATTLLKASKLATVFPRLVGKQDDGGWMSLYPAAAFVSEVETQSPLTHFKITLSVYGSKKSAAAAYKSEVGGAAKLVGVGDRAAVFHNLQAVVLKGSQVLLVQVFTTPAGDDLIAQQGKSPQVMDQVLQLPMLAATKALVRHANGKPAKKPYTHLPAGAQDPCGVTAATLKATSHQSVTLAAAPSERTPSQQCDYTIKGDPFIVQTLTNAQAVAESPPTTLEAVYDADLAATAGSAHKTLTATVGRVRMFMVPGGDWTAEALVDVPAASGPTTGVQGARANGGLGLHPELLRDETGYTFPIDFEQCLSLFLGEVLHAVRPQITQLGPLMAKDAYYTLGHRITDFCENVAGITPNDG